MERLEFLRHYQDYRKQRIDRRTFLKVTGLGTAAAVIAACAPAPAATTAPTPGTPSTAAPTDGGSEPSAPTDPSGDWTPPEGVDLGETLELTTWPNYHDPKTLDLFTQLTGVTINVTVFGSNEEMLAKLQAGGTGWDVLVPTN